MKRTEPISHTIPEMSKDELRYFSTHVQKWAGICLSETKLSLVRTRLGRRLRANSLTNWGINTNNNGITMTATLDFQNDTATFSYNNANNSDGDVTIFTGSYTGSSINKLRITAVGNDLFTDGDGAYLSVDDLTISAVAVPEPSQVALAIAILSFGAVILRRKGRARLSN